MTISTTSSSVTLAGNGATSTFSFPFVAASASDIVVTYTNASGAQTVLTPSQYTLFIAAVPSGAIWGVGGTVTYPISGTPIAAGTTLTIARAVPNTQLISISNQGDFYPAVVEQALDTICMEVQQAATTASQAIRINPADTALAVPLPVAAQRANQLLGFDSAGQPIAAQPSNALVSTPMQPIVDAASTVAAMALLGASTNATPSLSVAPTANPSLPTLTSFNVQGVTGAANEREFLVNLGLVVNQGSGATGNARDKVVLYAGADVQAGAGDTWCINTVITMESGSGTNNNQGYELDFNNLNADRGDTAAGGGLSAPIATGLSITGAGTYLSTSALLVSGPGSAIWNRGITIANNSVAQASFQDLGNATTVFSIYGNHTYGLDMSQGSVTYPIRIANGGIISARNQANTTDVPMLQLDTSNVLHVGGAGLSSIDTYTGPLQPGSDNAYSLGTASNRWTAVYAVNGTIQTSDPEQKTDITKLPPVLGLVRGLDPVTFRWKVGGIERETVTEKQMVHATETHEWDEDAVEMRDGRAVRVKRHHSEEVPLFDKVPVVDEDGAPVIDRVEAVAELRDKDGRVVRPAQPERLVPRVHREPRMVEADVQVTKGVEREGRRTHWGFLAPEVCDAFGKLGVDFGGYVKTPEGEHALRPDQLIPVLWKAVQELAAEVETLRKGATV